MNEEKENKNVDIDDESCFVELTESEFNNLQNKKNNKMYIIKGDFDSETINQINIVIKYILLQYRENSGQLIRTMRQLAGEEFIFPKVETSVVENISTLYIAYKVFSRWIDNNGNPISGVVPSSNTTYYAERINIEVPKKAYMKASASTTNSQTMVKQFIILAPYNIYIKDTNYLTYIVKPTCLYSTVGSLKKTNVSFKIQNLSYTAGQTQLIEPEFVLYKNSSYTEEIEKITIPIEIESTSQPSGD